jgi:hypothetical protein
MLLFFKLREISLCGVEIVQKWLHLSVTNAVCFTPHKEPTTDLCKRTESSVVSETSRTPHFTTIALQMAVRPLASSSGHHLTHRDPQYTFLLGAELTPRPLCGWKDLANWQMQRPHCKWNQKPLSIEQSASYNWVLQANNIKYFNRVLQCQTSQEPHQTLLIPFMLYKTRNVADLISK